jgi:hypothetical protein
MAETEDTAPERARLMPRTATVIGLGAPTQHQLDNTEDLYYALLSPLMFYETRSSTNLSAIRRL